MDNSLRSDKSMLPHNASPHRPRISFPLRHGKGSGSFGLVDVTDAKEPAFSLPPSARHPLYSTFRPVARPFCTPAFGPGILRPYASLRADRSESASGYAALPPSARHPLYSTFRPRSQTLLHAGVWAAYFAALCAAACRLERERVWIRGRKVPTYAGGGRGRIFFYIRSMKRGSADRCSSFRRWSY